MSEWIKVGDAMPNDCEQVLIREYYKSPRYGKFRNDYRVAYYFEKYGFEGEIQNKRWCYGYRVTHWMRIPEIK